MLEERESELKQAATQKVVGRKVSGERVNYDAG